MAKMHVTFQFTVSMEVKNENDRAEIARTGRKGILGLLESDSIQDNIQEIVPVREDSYVDEISEDVEEEDEDETRDEFTDEEIHAFLKEFGNSDEQMGDVEMAVNTGWVWLEKYGMWIKKNNMFYSDRQEDLVSYLIDTCG